MSDYGEEIIDRVNNISRLKDKDNPMNKIIDNTIGEWLDNYSNKSFFEQIFLNEASEGYLDLHGIQRNVYRTVGESDADYYKRIVYESLGHLTANYVNDIYDLTLFVNVGFQISERTVFYNTDFFDGGAVYLTSDNPYINSHDGYFIIIDGYWDSYWYNSLNKKMVLGDRVKWATTSPF